MKALSFFLILLSALTAGAQQPILTQRELLDIVRAYHPVARQAALQLSIAEADQLTARGGFDPVLQSASGRKEVDGTVYYQHTQHELKIPVWYGMDIHLGAEAINGTRNHPADTRGQSSYIGFSMPLARNLLMDKRRAAVKGAEIFRQLSQAQQKETLNNLMSEALKAYWNWWEQHTARQSFNRALANAEKRVQLVRTAWKLGERPAIDTLEALSQLQAFHVQRNELELQLYAAGLELSAFLWRADATAYELPEGVAPEKEAGAFPTQLQSVEQLLSTATAHPQLQQYRFKLEALEVERRLKRQSLLPDVRVKYNQLTKGYNLGKAVAGPWLQNNYRYGVSVNLPLRFSEGRGEYRKVKLKVEQAQLEQSLKEVQIRNKVMQYHNEWKGLQQQVQLQQQTAGMLQTLQRGEEQKFLSGESSLFLINSREAKALEAELKLIATRSKLQKAAGQLIWAAGLFAE